MLIIFLSSWLMDKVQCCGWLSPSRNLFIKVFNSTSNSLSFTVNQPGQNCTGDSKGIGETSPWAHELAGLHPDAAHLPGKRSDRNDSPIKRLVETVLKKHNVPLFWRFILFFCFQSCSYQTKQTSSMLCPRRQTLTLFCASSPKARRNHWEPRLAWGGTQSSTCGLQILHMEDELVFSFNSCRVRKVCSPRRSILFFWIPKR